VFEPEKQQINQRKCGNALSNCIGIYISEKAPALHGCALNPSMSSDGIYVLIRAITGRAVRFFV
jgi:hypothetical protein